MGRQALAEAQDRLERELQSSVLRARAAGLSETRLRMSMAKAGLFSMVPFSTNQPDPPEDSPLWDDAAFLVRAFLRARARRSKERWSL